MGLNKKAHTAAELIIQPRGPTMLRSKSYTLNIKVDIIYAPLLQADIICFESLPPRNPWCLDTSIIRDYKSRESYAAWDDAGGPHKQPASPVSSTQKWTQGTGANLDQHILHSVQTWFAHLKRSYFLAAEVDLELRVWAHLLLFVHTRGLTRAITKTSLWIGGLIVTGGIAFAIRKLFSLYEENFS